MRWEGTGSRDLDFICVATLAILWAGFPLLYGITWELFVGNVLGSIVPLLLLWKGRDR